MMSAIKEGVTAGVLAPNEGRAKVNLPPVTGGDVDAVQDAAGGWSSSLRPGPGWNSRWEHNTSGHAQVPTVASHISGPSSGSQHELGREFIKGAWEELRRLSRSR